MARKSRYDWTSFKPSAQCIRVECHVNVSCNAQCLHCNIGIGLVKQKSDMTVEQMKGFIDQIIDQKIHVSRFTLGGGEPILNKNLQGLIDEVSRLPGLKIGRVLTNGMPVSQKLRDKIRLPKRFHWIVNPLDNPDDPLSGKNDPSKRPNGRVHSPFWISPADVGMESDYSHCHSRGWCGIGLSPEGWSMCGKAVLLGKLLGIEDVAMKEGDVISHVGTPRNEICRHCQYGLPGGDKERTEVAKRYKAGELPEVSETFQRAFDKFNNKELVQIGT